MSKVKSIVINVLMFVLVWYGSQSIFGFIAGVAMGCSGMEFNETAMMILIYGGILTSIIGEVIFLGIKLNNKKEKA